MNTRITKVMGFIAIAFAYNTVTTHAVTSINAQSVSPSFRAELDLQSEELAAFEVDFFQETNFESVFEADILVSTNISNSFQGQGVSATDSVDVQINSLQNVWNEASAEISDGAGFVIAAINQGYAPQATMAFAMEQSVPADVILISAINANVSVETLASEIAKISGPARAQLQTSLYWIMVKSGTPAAKAREIVFG